MSYNNYDLLKIGNIDLTFQRTSAINLRGKQINGLINYQNIDLIDPRVNENNLKNFIVFMVHVTRDFRIEKVNEFLMNLAQFPFIGLKVEIYKNKIPVKLKASL